MKRTALIVLLSLFYFPAFSQEIYFTPSNDCENAIIRNIERASQIDIAVYAINNDNIVESIKKAHKDGKKIRIITDRLQAANKYSKVKDLKELGLPVLLNRKHKIEHNKFAVFDHKTVVSGSYNWTNPASAKNSENCLFIEDTAQEYHNRFEYLWNFYQK